MRKACCRVYERWESIMEIELLYQDKDIVVCIKPVGLLSEKGGVPDILSRQCGEKEIYTVHRLDRAVGGVMVYAKSSAAAARLSAAMGTGGFSKEYLAVVHGCPEAESGTMQDLLFKDASKNKSYVVKRMRKGVKEASLEYRLLEEKNNMSLVRIRLHTGRSHQIRVQFSSRKMPLVGDVKYGSSNKDCDIALFSASLSFPHPKSGELFSFSAPVPDAFPWNEFKELC